MYFNRFMNIGDGLFVVFTR